MKPFFGALGALASLLAGICQAEVIHQERSLYRNIVITEQQGQRCMRFVVHDRALHNQSCIYINKPQEQVFDYTKMMMTALLFQPQPARILVVGLGGGTLPRALHELLPQAQITSVEIDPAVIKAARQFFLYQENAQVSTQALDARVFIKRALRDKRTWDLILLDAFNGDYIPEHLMTQEFLQEVRQVLSPQGLVAANTFASSRLYHHESVTYEKVFPHLGVLASYKGNRVIFASPVPLQWPSPEAAQQQWGARLAPYGLDLPALLNLQVQPNWDKTARPLTDQYAPANILNQQ
jgi:spermidine synthase